MFFSKAEMKSIVDSLENPLSIGDSVKLNHDGCPAGKDTKKRLNLTRIDKGTLFYCYHCQSKGLLRNEVFLRADVLLTDTHREREHIGLNLFSAYNSLVDVPKLTTWKMNPLMWWLSYGFDEEDAKMFGVRVIGDDGIYLPGRSLFDWDTINVLQCRSFRPAGPKYWTHKRNEGVVGMVASSSPTVYVVEDLLSSYKLYKAGKNVVCLMGTSLSSAVKSAIISTYKKAVVWLDDDVAGVTKGPIVTMELSPFMYVDTLVNTQPKDKSLEELIAL